MLKAKLFNAAYAKQFFDWYYDPRLRPFFRGYLQGISMAEALDAPTFMKSHLLVAFNEENPDKAVALASFSIINPIARSIKFGLLVDPDCQHAGVAKEFTPLAVSWCFHNMNANRLEAKIVSEDERLLKGTRIFGFKEEGVTRQSTFFDGKYHDEVIFSILQSDLK